MRMRMDFKDFKYLFFYNFDDLHGTGGDPGCVDAELMSIFTRACIFRSMRMDADGKMHFPREAKLDLGSPPRRGGGLRDRSTG